ncbi:MAG: hypothetical protein LBD55_01800 [Treponema sp.]|jgi:hypothetical protein|nr:hypothetical protein [Treponema sp.]
MEIKRAIDCGDAIREKFSALFVDGFGKDLKYFSKDTNKLTKAFSHMFVLEYFYVAVLDNEIAGMVVCIDKEHFCINHNKAILKKHLGILKGSIANSLLKNYFNKQPQGRALRYCEDFSLKYLHMRGNKSPAPPSGRPRGAGY